MFPGIARLQSSDEVASEFSVQSLISALSCHTIYLPTQNGAGLNLRNQTAFNNSKYPITRLNIDYEDGELPGPSIRQLLLPKCILDPPEYATMSAFVCRSCRSALSSTRYSRSQANGSKRYIGSSRPSIEDAEGSAETKAEIRSYYRPNIQLLDAPKYNSNTRPKGPPQPGDAKFGIQRPVGEGVYKVKIAPRLIAPPFKRVEMSPEQIFQGPVGKGTSKGSVGRVKVPSSAKRESQNTPRELDDIDSFLSKPTWSVSSLLSDKPIEDRLIPKEKFEHLLRLSGLPTRTKHTEDLRRDVSEHLHFVDALQEVNTDGVEPLVVLRNETEQGVKDITIGLEDLKEALDKEEIKGRMKRPRRKSEEVVMTIDNEVKVEELAERESADPQLLARKKTEEIMQIKREEEWDCLSHASETMEHAGAKYFVVRAAKPKEELKEQPKEGPKEEPYKEPKRAPKKGVSDEERLAKLLDEEMDAMIEESS